MKIQLAVSIAVTMLISGQDLSLAQKFYLSPQGNNSNPGTKEKPLADLQGALHKTREYRMSTNVSQPVEIIALEGEYFMLSPLMLKSDDSGTENSPLIFKAEDGTKAVFRGGVKLEGFEKVNEKLWRVFVPQVAYYNSYFEQLYVNGQRAVRARTPNEGFYLVKNVSETVIDKGEGSFLKLAVQKIKLNDNEAKCFTAFTSTDFQDALVTFYHKWDNTRKHIAGFDKNSSSIYTVGEGMKQWNSIDSISRYYVENYKDALDAPGEWFLDRSGYLYYIPEEGESIENTSFFAPVLKEFIVAQGDSITGKRVENIHLKTLILRLQDMLLLLREMNRHRRQLQ